MPSENYRGFIKEAFIKPIRSVLIVDDDYPTFDEILVSQMEANKEDQPPKMNSEKNWYRDPVSIRSVLNRFRAADQSLLVDIHDGNNVEIGQEAEAASHLHQSDLLVLDYQLDRTNKGDGTKAIDIARSIGRNSHFNMVLVHTSEPLPGVFRNMLVGLMGPIAGIVKEDEAANLADTLFELDSEFPGASDRLKDLVSIEHYLHFRRQENALHFDKIDAPSIDGITLFFKEIGLKNKDEQKALYHWALNERQEVMKPAMNVHDSLALSWSDQAPRWLRTDSLFMAFSKKGVNDDLLEDLLTTLTAWNPRPSRLFLASLRNQLEEKGVLAESRALGSNHVLAHWYSRLLKSEGAERSTLITESVSRHSEQLLKFVLPDVIDFASRLVSTEDSDPNELCKAYFDVDLSNQASFDRSQMEHNAFVCSKKVEGFHLTTGHILQIGEDIFACLSPSCDLVPGKKKPERYGDIGDTLPFVAVRLQYYDTVKLPKKIQSNRFVFLEIDGLIKTYSINNPTIEGSAPHSFTLYAEQEGVFDPDVRELMVQQIVSDGKGGLCSSSRPATIIAQLRYEYALNLLQKLGSVMGRVGLDYAGN